jgi:hypothetical protein
MRFINHGIKQGLEIAVVKCRFAPINFGGDKISSADFGDSSASDCSVVGIGVDTMIIYAFYFFHTIYIGAGVPGALVVRHFFFKKTDLTYFFNRTNKKFMVFV